MRQKSKRFFYKNMSHRKMVDFLNEQYPINLIDYYCYGLIDRVHTRYPYLQKYEVFIIIKTIFQTFRETLVSGKRLKIRDVGSLKLYFFDFFRFGRTFTSLRVHSKTPRKLRKDV